jgi:glycosyltransferase involved in cell wall biosynthesis
VQTLLAARHFRVPVFFRSIDILNRLSPYKLLSPPTRALEGLVYRRVEGISCVTPHLRDYVKSYGVPASRIEVLPSGVDVQMFSPGPGDVELLSKWGIGPADPVVLFMGTVYTFSGLDRLIQGFKDVLARHPQARLLVVGVGEDADRLQRLASANNLQTHVIFAGFQPYSLLPDIIRSSTVCINPFELNDITRDILPTKLFQYLACGKPVLMTELPGTLPFLAGPSDGVVYSGSDEFVRNLNELLSNPSRITELGANALRVAQRDYDWKSIAVKLLAWMKDRMP